MKRQGLGKGLGMGYKNIVPFDSHIHSLSAKGITTHKAGKNLWLTSGNKKPTPKSLNEKVMERFFELTNNLSPENLSCDGELSQSQIHKRHTEIMTEWRQLENKIGMKVTEADAWEWYDHKKANELNALAVRKADFFRPLHLNGKELTHIIFYDKNGMLLDSGHGWLEDERGRDIEQMDVPDNLPVKRKEDFTEKYGFLIAEPQDSIDRKYKTHKAKLYLPFKDDEWTFSIKLEDWYPTYSSEYKVWKNDKTGAVIRQHLRNIPKEKNVKYQKQMEELSGLMGKDNPSAHTLDQNKPEIKKKIKQMAQDIDAGLYAKGQRDLLGNIVPDEQVQQALSQLAPQDETKKMMKPTVVSNVRQRGEDVVSQIKNIKDPLIENVTLDDYGNYSGTIFVKLKSNQAERGRFILGDYQNYPDAKKFNIKKVIGKINSELAKARATKPMSIRILDKPARQYEQIYIGKGYPRPPKEFVGYDKDYIEIDYEV